jgi:hypothetical protein
MLATDLTVSRHPPNGYPSCEGRSRVRFSALFRRACLVICGATDALDDGDPSASDEDRTDVGGRFLPRWDASPSTIAGAGPRRRRGEDHERQKHRDADNGDKEDELRVRGRIRARRVRDRLTPGDWLRDRSLCGPRRTHVLPGRIERKGAPESLRRGRRFRRGDAGGRIAEGEQDAARHTRENARSRQRGVTASQGGARTSRRCEILPPPGGTRVPNVTLAAGCSSSRSQRFRSSHART